MTKILLVEDDKSLREIYGVRLLAEGYDIVSAGDGEDALAMAIKEKPTLIISDVMMPKISGFDMLDILRSTTETRDIKVIMMTALSSEDQRARGEQLGADRYLVKSQVGIEDVVRTVHEVLGDIPGASTPAAPASTPTPTAEPAAPADTEPAANETPTPVSTTEEDSAGPLPPQPTEVAAPAPVIEPAVSSPEPSLPESSLPQPTAPFSSPRPANLGEQAIHPEESASTAELSPTDTTVAPVDTPAPVASNIAAPAPEPIAAEEQPAEPLPAPLTAEPTPENTEQPTTPAA